ncbi:MAG: DUF2917 domain-containing protein [Burkholderiales bacterium]|nr:DUF2917 domain-containing protein [Burkholderiales bacterium]
MRADITLKPNDSAVRLQRDQHMRLQDARGWQIKSVNGTVWLTQEGDSRDIVLRKGQSFVLDRDGTALLSALNDADLCLQAS